MELLEFALQTEQVLTILLFVSFLGIGVFVKTMLWPWFVEYTRVHQENYNAHRNAQIQLLKDSQNRWDEAAKQTNISLDKMSEELAVMRNLIMMYLEVMSTANPSLKKEVLTALDERKTGPTIN